MQKGAIQRPEAIIIDFDGVVHNSEVLERITILRSVFVTVAEDSSLALKLSIANKKWEKVR